MSSSRLIVLVIVIIVLAGAAATAALYLVSRGRASTTATLPSDCVKPPDGFLVVASSTGYNDSIGHGAPYKDWPIITVQQGQTVNITVCNTDFQAHGFQVTHYYDSNIVTVLPGQVLHVSFVANEAGEFRIYCDVFCSIHIYMQNGELVVTPN